MPHILPIYGHSRTQICVQMCSQTHYTFAVRLPPYCTYCSGFLMNSSVAMDCYAIWFFQVDGSTPFLYQHCT